MKKKKLESFKFIEVLMFEKSVPFLLRKLCKSAVWFLKKNDMLVTFTL